MGPAANQAILCQFFFSTLTRTDGYPFPNNPPLLKMIGLVIFRSFLCQLTNRPHSPSKLQKCVSCNKIQKKKRPKDFFKKKRKGYRTCKGRTEKQGQVEPKSDRKLYIKSIKERWGRVVPSSDGPQMASTECRLQRN